MARRGFTFVEMMVSVSIVVFAATLMLPTLKEARQTSNVAECMSNQKQLTEAFVSYSVSNGRKIIISHPAREYPVLEEEMQGFSSSSLPGSWMGGLGTPSTDRWALAGNSEEAITQGALFPYINDVTKFRCPNDWSNHERSYSASGFLNGETHWGDMPWPSTIKTLNGVQYPSRTMVFMEENDPRGWNVGSWVIHPKQHPTRNEQWVDYVAVFHQGGDNVSFSDGHVEYWEYQDERTLEFADNKYHFYARHPGSPDLQRYQNAYNPGDPNGYRY